jgi:hypothetical protein
MLAVLRLLYVLSACKLMTVELVLKLLQRAWRRACQARGHDAHAMRK